MASYALKPWEHPEPFGTYACRGRVLESAWTVPAVILWSGRKQAAVAHLSIVVN